MPSLPFHVELSCLGPFLRLFLRIADQFYCFIFILNIISISLNYSNASKMTRLCFKEHFVAILSVHKSGKIKSKLQNFQNVYWKEQDSCVDCQRKFRRVYYFQKLQVMFWYGSVVLKFKLDDVQACELYAELFL